MKKQTVLDQMEITRDGTIQVRFAKEIIDDDGNVLAQDWHRTVFSPGHNIDAQMNEVNISLASIKSCPVAVRCIEKIKALAATAWTGEVLTLHRMNTELSVQKTSDRLPQE